MNHKTLFKLGKSYLPVFERYNGNILRTGSAQSINAIRKTAKELDLTMSHVRSALEAYQWG